MERKTFKAFWDTWSTAWYNSEFMLRGVTIPVKSMCQIKSGYEQTLYRHYQIIKKTVKDAYFKDTEKLLSRYKRAAVIAYAINEASPLIYTDQNVQEDMDSNFLKQRLAFFVAIGSIVQDYSDELVKNAEGPIFDFEHLGRQYLSKDEDDFLLSVYKDLFYSDIYENYNVLTMANVFGLLTERASKLSELTPLDDVAQAT